MRLPSDQLSTTLAFQHGSGIEDFEFILTFISKTQSQSRCQSQSQLKFQYQFELQSLLQYHLQLYFELAIVDVDSLQCQAWIEIKIQPSLDTLFCVYALHIWRQNSLPWTPVSSGSKYLRGQVVKKYWKLLSLRFDSLRLASLHCQPDVLASHAPWMFIFTFGLGASWMSVSCRPMREICMEGIAVKIIIIDLGYEACHMALSALLSYSTLFYILHHISPWLCADFTSLVV